MKEYAEELFVTDVNVPKNKTIIDRRAAILRDVIIVPPSSWSFQVVLSYLKSTHSPAIFL